MSAISTVAGEESMVFHGNSEVKGQSLTRGSVYVGDHLVVENGVDVTRGEMGVKLKSSAERALKYTTDPGRFPINSISYSPDEIVVSLITEANITQDSIVIFLDVDRSCSALGNTRQIFAVKHSVGKSVVLRALDSAPFANCSKTGAIKVISEGGSVVSIAEVKNGSTFNLSSQAFQDNDYVLLEGLMSADSDGVDGVIGRVNWFQETKFNSILMLVLVA